MKLVKYGFPAVIIAIIALIAYFYLSSGTMHQAVARYTGYSTICVDGVKYIQFTSGASVQYGTDGKVVTCR